MNNLKSMLFVVIFLISMPIEAGDKNVEGSAVIVQPHQAVVQVKGVVCSFCAYGAQKNLQKLTFLDHSLFNEGVLMDIHTLHITLALDPDKEVNLKEIVQAIKKGGYDPLKIYYRPRGEDRIEVVDVSKIEET